MNLRQGRIGNQEAVAMAFLSCIACGVFSTNTKLTYAAGNGSYLVSAFSATLSLLLVTVVAEGMRRARCKNLAQLYRYAFGPVLSAPAAFITLIALIYAAAMPLVRLLMIMNHYIYILDNVQNVALYLIPCVLTLAWMGLEIIGRTARLFFVVIVLSFFVALIIAIPAYAPYRLYPLLGNGLASTARLSLMGINRFFPALIGLFICGAGVHGVNSSLRCASIAAFGGGLVVVVIQLLLGMTFPYYILSDIPAPLYRLTMALPSGSMFLRADKVLLFFWLLSGLVTAGYFAYSGALLFSGASNMRDIRPASAAVALTVCSVALMGQLNLSAFHAAVSFLQDKVWALLVLPPLLAAVLAMLKKRGAA